MEEEGGARGFAEESWIGVTMSDLIRRRDAVSRMSELLMMELQGQMLPTWNEVYQAMNDIPSAEPDQKWIPVTERLPEDKDWYLGIFKESDTGFCISVPFVCYYAGRKTMITTKDYWILRGYDDIYSFSEYFRNLECAAWMPLPEPYRGE